MDPCIAILGGGGILQVSEARRKELLQSGVLESHSAFLAVSLQHCSLVQASGEVPAGGRLRQLACMNAVAGGVQLRP